MGKGIAVEFRRRWPEMYERLRELCSAGEFVPGSVFTWEADDVVVFNLGTQRTWRTPATLEAIELSFRALAVEARRLDVRRVAIPRIGAGLGGLEWHDVRSTIEAATADEIEVVVCTPAS
jgi:O-acetyl-ADP-ribose deacetylase (regulator of RNase III)